MKNIRYYFARYIQEFLEIFIALIIYKSFVYKKVDIKKVTLMSFVIGFFTLLLEEYDKKYNSTVKNSLLMAVGSQAIQY